MNSALPAQAPAFAGYVSAPENIPAGQVPDPVVIVLDTGWRARPGGAGVTVRPLVLGGQIADDEPQPADGVATNRQLGAQAGHGTFISELICRLAPTATIVPHRVLNSDGLCDETELVDALGLVFDFAVANPDTPIILNLSLSSYLENDEITLLLDGALLALEARPNIVVVAAAGNAGSSRRAFPAAVDGVIGVGALGRDGVPAWTNWGPWVRACAPGVDVVSRFFNETFVVEDVAGVEHRTRYQGWTKWSGTSFAAPFVAAALARHVSRSRAAGETAAGLLNAAVAELIDSLELATLPGLGTVVNGS
jgi:subtilisin family serine protease